MQASYEGKSVRTWRPIRWVACLGALAVGICGCTGFWEDMTSTDFKMSKLFSKPDPLVVLRDSTDGTMRAKALRHLREPLQNGGTQKDQDAYVQILTTAATKDKEMLCRMAAISALAKFKDPRAIPVLTKADETAIKDFDPEKGKYVRIQALNALGENRSPEAEKWLALVARAGAKEEGQSEMLQTLDIRLAAIRSLGKYKDDANARDTLLKVMKTERDIALRDEAHQALELVTGKHLPADAAAWENGPPGAPPGSNGSLAQDGAKKIVLTGAH